MVTIINPGHSKALLIMDLLRFLTLTAMKHNFLLRACQVLGVSNNIADAVPISGGTFQGSHPHGRSGPLHHPAFLNDPLRHGVLRYANWRLAWRTNRTYGSGERRFIRFCLMHRLVHDSGDILPASEGWPVMLGHPSTALRVKVFALVPPLQRLLPACQTG